MSDRNVRLGWDAKIPVTYALVAGLVVVHVATAVAQWKSGHAGLLDGLLFARDGRFRAAVGGKYRVLVADEPWRLLTTTWLHADGLHLAVNAVAVGALGRILEPWIGGLRLAAWFLAGGLAGALASVAAGVSRSDGASGGAFALIGAALVLGWRVRERLDEDDRRLMGPILGGFVALNLALTFILPFIDAAGHIGGLALGLAVGAVARVDGPTPWTGSRGVRGGEALFVAGCLIGALGGWASLVY